MEFLDRIRFMRTKNNMTQAQLAVIVDKGEGAIRAWETGRAKPDADTLIILAKHFNVSTDFLLGLSDLETYGNSESHTECVALSISDEHISKENKTIYMEIQRSVSDLLQVLTRCVVSYNKPSLEKISLCLSYFVLTLTFIFEIDEGDLSNDDLAVRLKGTYVIPSFIKDNLEELALSICSEAVEKTGKFSDTEKILVRDYIGKMNIDLKEFGILPSKHSKKKQK